MNESTPHAAHTIQYEGDGDLALRLAWSPDGTRLAVGGSTGAVEIWSVSPLARLLTYSGHSDRITSLSWSPDGAKIASSGPGGVVRVWDAQSGRDLPAALWQGVTDVTWSPDGRCLALLHIDGRVRLALWEGEPQNG
jgi:WD40 repeat protein